MNDSVYKQLLEESWRRKLTSAEENELRAWLARHPEARAEWESDLALTGALSRLPDAPVPGNFTARVLQEIERENARETRAQASRKISWHSFLPKAAVAAIALGLTAFTYREHRLNEKVALAQSVAAVSEVSSLPDPEILQDFDAIRRLNQLPPDQELLTLFQ